MSDSSESSDREFSEDGYGGDEDVPDNVEEWTDFEDDTNEAVENDHKKEFDLKVHLQKHHDCESRNIVYIIQCKKCWWGQYIGETKHSLATRFKQHLGYVNRRDLS